MVQECKLQVGKTAVTIIDVGASIRSVELCDREGQVEDVVLGHQSLEDYKVLPRAKGSLSQESPVTK